MQDLPQEVKDILIASTVIILLLTISIIVFMFINQKRKFRHRQQLENQKKFFDEEILRAQLEIQSQTFETISRELHDNVSNTLSLALLNLNLLTNGQSQESASRIDETKTLLLEAKNSVKDYSWYINPENINNQGLKQSLQQLMKKFGNLKLFNLNFKSSGEEFTLESSRQIIIYRIVQEALSNTVKHADASEVGLNLEFRHPQLKISIQDNGSGFDTLQILSTNIKTHGAGLKNMIARASMIKAKLDINSQPGKGTTLILSCISEIKEYDQKIATNI